MIVSEHPRGASIPDPPQSVVAWVVLFALIAACGAGGVWVGTISGRVEALERFDPLSVDRRLGLIEGQNKQIQDQVQEIKQLLQARERRDAAEVWGSRPR